MTPRDPFEQVPEPDHRAEDAALAGLAFVLGAAAIAFATWFFAS